MSSFLISQDGNIDILSMFSIVQLIVSMGKI